MAFGVATFTAFEGTPWSSSHSIQPVLVAVIIVVSFCSGAATGSSGIGGALIMPTLVFIGVDVRQAIVTSMVSTNVIKLKKKARCSKAYKATRVVGLL